jgi:hypothetical protein
MYYNREKAKVREGAVRGTYELRRLENVLTAGQWPER